MKMTKRFFHELVGLCFREQQLFVMGETDDLDELWEEAEKKAGGKDKLKKSLDQALERSYDLARLYKKDKPCECKGKYICEWCMRKVEWEEEEDWGFELQTTTDDEIYLISLLTNNITKKYYVDEGFTKNEITFQFAHIPETNF